MITFLRGDITPAYARMRSVHQVNLLQKSVRHTLSHALFLVIFWTLMAGFAFFGTAVRFAGAVSPPLGPFWISIVWSGIQTLMAFYVTGAIIFSVAYFHCVAWYFRIRFKRLNKIVFALLDQRGVIPASKRAEFMREVVYEHSSAAHDVAHANRFWKFYLMACYFIYVPIEFWLLYTACYYFVGNWVVKLISWVAFLQIGFLFSLIIASGEMVQNQVISLSSCEVCFMLFEKGSSTLEMAQYALSLPLSDWGQAEDGKSPRTTGRTNSWLHML